MVSKVETLMVRGKVRAHCAVCGLGNLLWMVVQVVQACSDPNVWAGLVVLVTSVPVRILAQLLVRQSCAWGAEVSPVPWKGRESMFSVQRQELGQGERPLSRAGLGREVRLK
jgi:hypothetical protein